MPLNGLSRKAAKMTIRLFKSNNTSPEDHHLRRATTPEAVPDTAIQYKIKSRLGFPYKVVPASNAHGMDGRTATMPKKQGGLMGFDNTNLKQKLRASFRRAMVNGRTALRRQNAPTTMTTSPKCQFGPEDVIQSIESATDEVFDGHNGSQRQHATSLAEKDSRVSRADFASLSRSPKDTRFQHQSPTSLPSFPDSSDEDTHDESNLWSSNGTLPTHSRETSVGTVIHHEENTKSVDQFDDTCVGAEHASIARDAEAVLRVSEWAVARTNDEFPTPPPANDLVAVNRLLLGNPNHFSPPDVDIHESERLEVPATELAMHSYSTNAQLASSLCPDVGIKYRSPGTSFQQPDVASDVVYASVSEHSHGNGPEGLRFSESRSIPPLHRRTKRRNIRFQFILDEFAEEPSPQGSYTVDSSDSQKWPHHTLPTIAESEVEHVDESLVYSVPLEDPFLEEDPFAEFF